MEFLMFEPGCTKDQLGQQLWSNSGTASPRANCCKPSVDASATELGTGNSQMCVPEVGCCPRNTAATPEISSNTTVKRAELSWCKVPERQDKTWSQASGRSSSRGLEIFWRLPVRPLRNGRAKETPGSTFRASLRLVAPFIPRLRLEGDAANS